MIDPYVTCTVCGKDKAPRGRSVPLSTSWCDLDCRGYELEPLPSLWFPGERDEEPGQSFIIIDAPEVDEWNYELGRDAEINGKWYPITEIITEGKDGDPDEALLVVEFGRGGILAVPHLLDLGCRVRFLTGSDMRAKYEATK